MLDSKIIFPLNLKEEPVINGRCSIFYYKNKKDKVDKYKMESINMKKLAFVGLLLGVGSAGIITSKINSIVSKKAAR